MNDTICAISTAHGNGAIAVIRLSGDDTFKITGKIFFPVKEKNDILNPAANTVIFGTIKYNNIIIDEVLVSFFKAPNTYTGEDIVEISCHGSQYIQQQILQLLIKTGARLAMPGEFTQRAYLNGKMDLSQAEAVADLIASTGAAAHKIAINQMRGGFSNELANLRKNLLQFISLIELELDFSEEDIEFADRNELLKLIDNIYVIISKLIKSFELGNVIKNGVPVAIIGETNVGKSTLLNAVLNEEKAIVSHIAGTTRDSIEDTFNYNGISFRFIDTAGIRKTSDTIESLGIERTFQKMNQAKVILVLFDVNDTEEKISNDLKLITQKVGDNKTIFAVINKIDTANSSPVKIENKLIYSQVNISAKNNENINILLDEISKSLHLDQIDNNDVIVSNARHFEALTLAIESLERAKNGILSGISNDFLAIDIREVIHYLAGITGEEISTDEILGNIFRQFCIGK
jgi:tRNA modification GTPase